MTSYPVTGGCQCNAVRYSLGAEPLFSEVCHCDSCRRATGAESVGWLTEPAESFRIEHGALTLHESSPGVTRGFCGRCGTTLTYQNGAETIDVTLASLDDPELFPPRAEIWLEERLSWNPANPRLEQHERGGGGGG
ncbi:GFA family protein [Amaricoccus solimangrovi]|nr:GFA family protein [Amaricoccus solimangrovi]